ncbi:hypothetical protein [Pedobacter yonginense]|uniref:hypothetical protein n=1 Tax=Pedobacter yonginense TaxID=651869 RepID=UPI001403B64E|nr:hypothetical protein [Pedobacter yonginense]
MKTKKLEKKTAFVFKKNVVKELTKDEMNQINSGGGGVKPLSGTPICKNFTMKTFGN